MVAEELAPRVPVGAELPGAASAPEVSVVSEGLLVSGAPGVPGAPADAEVLRCEPVEAPVAVRSAGEVVAEGRVLCFPLFRLPECVLFEFVFRVVLFAAVLAVVFAVVLAAMLVAVFIEAFVGRSWLLSALAWVAEAVPG